MAEAASSVPEIYADTVDVVTTNLGIFLGFRAVGLFGLPHSERDESGSGEAIPMPLKAIVRLSQEEAKTFAIMLRRAIKQYESQNGTIGIPEALVQLLENENDEW